MCRKEVRTLSQALTLRYDKVLFILDPTDLSRSLAGKKVVVCDYPDGRLEIMHESFALPYRTFDTLRSVHRAEVVDNKRLDDMLSVVAELQAGREQQRRRADHGELGRRTICSAFAMAARGTATRSVDASRERIT
ncbi:putative insertion sequence transposase protein [Rhizobium etli CNPAF512]|nr:putative insertion sequence transposase protein [Rhizobium etli CNPAF512]